MPRKPRSTKGQGRGIAWLIAHKDHAGEECLKWPFGGANGYGTHGHNGKLCYAHRTMCELVHGAAPSPTHEASHSCGLGHLGCVNPKHITWKTPSENQRDRAKHGTKATGPFGKINDEIAQRIRELRGVKTQQEIGLMFGISRAAVSLIQNGNRWGADKVKYRERRLVKTLRRKLPDGSVKIYTYPVRPRSVSAAD